MRFSKPKRVQDDEYRAFVKSKPCCACMEGPSDPHHLKTKGSGGDDYFCVPLCRTCHSMIGTLGRNTFQERMCVNLWEVCAKLLVEWVKKDRGEAK